MHASLLVIPLYSFIQRLASPASVHRNLCSTTSSSTRSRQKTSVVQLYHHQEEESASIFSLDDNINMPSSSTVRKKKIKKTKSEEGQEISIVGPDCIHVLQGQLFNNEPREDVVLVLCGESHQDSIDVTRRNGIFEAKEGWMDYDYNNNDFISTTTTATTTTTTATDDDNDNGGIDDWLVKVLVSSKKSLPIEKAKQWAKDSLERYYDDDYYTSVVLLWVNNNNNDGGEAANQRVSKGKSFLLAFSNEEEEDADEDSDDDNENSHWINPYTIRNDNISKNDDDDDDDGRRIVSLPFPVQDWIVNHRNNHKKTTTTTTDTTNNNKYKAFEWGDLDQQAFRLNRQRLLSSSNNKDIPTTSMIDEIINQRKEKLRSSSSNNKKIIWTWDDWFYHMKQQEQEEHVDIHLVLEASIPPWELSLHRPTTDEASVVSSLPPAADCIRRVEQDEEGDIEDEYDPSSDGIGSYLDYIYRRFMEESIIAAAAAEETKTKSSPSSSYNSSSWLHCVDSKFIMRSV